MQHRFFRLQRILSILFILSSLQAFLPNTESLAEPWLANRYAQNCAACHSPSRRNVAAKDRRCTLACQGCHVNPSGGGMRNEYGVWNQQRWLRSMKSDFFASKGTPAPLKFQKYANMPNDFSLSADSTSNNKKSKSKKNNKPLDLKEWDEMAKNGPPLVATTGVSYNEKNYDKSDEQEHITVASRSEFMARLTKDDPYRIERSRSVFGSGDFRYFYLDYEKKLSPGATTKFDGMLAMGMDLGVRVRPTPEHFQFVFENRYLQGPSPTEEKTSPERVFVSESRARSAYALVDDLPWSTYVQYGLYRPMFGHYNPDHTTLLNTMVSGGSSARAINKALTIGGSPNVPFANLHMIMPIDDSAYDSSAPFSADKGLAATLGARFVTLGASAMLSWWSTEGPRTTNGPDLKNNMLSLTAGFSFKNFVVNVDVTSIDREYTAGAADKAGVSSLEVKYRLWREVYGIFNYAASNAQRNLKKGSATEMMLGAKMFLLSSTEFEILMINREDKDDSTIDDSGIDSMDTTALQAQLHLFF